MRRTARVWHVFGFLLPWLATYLIVCIGLGIALGHLSIRLPRRAAGRAEQVSDRWLQQFGARRTDVHIGAADDATLRAWYAVPSHPNGRSVLLLHGIGGSRLDMSGFADMFLAQGYAVLLPDSRAHGDSGGELATYGILERDDVRRWTEWLRKAAPGCTFLLGESMGAAIGLQAAAITPNLCAIAVEDPYAHFRELAPERVGEELHTGTLLWKTLGLPVIDVAILYAWAHFHVWLPEADPMQALEQSHVPALLITGTRDLNIPMHHAQELQRVCARRCALWVVKGADHGGASSAAGHEFDRRILQWFAEHDSDRSPMRS